VLSWRQLRHSTTPTTVTRLKISLISRECSLTAHNEYRNTYHNNRYTVNYKWYYYLTNKVWHIIAKEFSFSVQGGIKSQAFSNCIFFLCWLLKLILSKCIRVLRVLFKNKSKGQSYYNYSNICKIHSCTYTYIVETVQKQPLHSDYTQYTTKVNSMALCPSVTT